MVISTQLQGWEGEGFTIQVAAGHVAGLVVESLRPARRAAPGGELRALPRVQFCSYNHHALLSLSNQHKPTRPALPPHLEVV